MLNNVNAGCFVGASLDNHLMYADDLVLLAPSAAGLSLLLSACSYYGIEFDVKFNSAKSNVMVFCCNLLKDIPVPNLMLNGVAIDKVSNCKYLGHCINDKLIDDDDMARQRKQIYAQGNAFGTKVLYVYRNCQNFPVQIVLLLFVHQFVMVQLPL